MISRYSLESLSWIDLEAPTREEVILLSEEHNLHPIVANELLATSERSKVDLYSDSIYLILHFPLRNRTSGRIEETEVDFVLFENTLITTHYELVDPLHDFARLFEVGSYLHHERKTSHAGFLFFAAIRELYKHTFFLLDSVGRETREIEKHIFGGNEAHMVARISNANRSLIDIRQALRYHKDTLRSFTAACKKIYGEDYAYYANAIQGQYEQIAQILEESLQTLRDLRETNDSLLSTKTNATIRKLTVVNIVMLPLGLIAWIFAMHSKYLSLDDPKALLAVFIGMAIICVVSIIYFRRRRWL